MSSQEHVVEDQVTPERSTGDLVKASLSGWLGTTLEFMDFQLYGLATALVFNKIFFPNIDPNAGLMASIATYATGYLARFAGAFYFGQLGDRIGRKKVLFYTIALMGMATTLIGALPTYNQVGLLAPALLVVLRLCQGFGAGAEIAGAGVMLAEYAQPAKRGVISSLVAWGTNSGTLGASLIWFILTSTMSDETIVAWAWRIPFLASFLIMGFAIWVRLSLKESPVFEAAQAEMPEEERAILKLPFGERFKLALRTMSWKSFGYAFLLRFGQAGNSGMLQTYVLGWFTAVLIIDKKIGPEVLMISSIIGFATILFSGWLGDKIGRRKMYIGLGVLAALWAVPMFMMFITKSYPMILVAFCIGHNLGVLMVFAQENVTMAEMFGSRNRYTLLAVAKEVAAMITTGFGPLVAGGLVALTGSWIPLAVLVIVYCLVLVATAIFMPETAGRDLTSLEDAA